MYNPLANQMFYPVPAQIALRKDIKNISKLVYGYLVKCFGADGLVCPKMATIARDLEITVRTVGKCIKELKGTGLIKSKRTGKASTYEFIPVEDRNTVGRSDRNTVGRSPSIILKDKEKTNNVVVVTSAENYGLKFDPGLSEEINSWLVGAVGTDPDKQYRKLIDLFEYTAERATSNPNGFIRAIVTSGGDIPRVKLSRPKVPVRMPEVKPEEIKPKTIDGQAKALGYKIPKKIRAGIPLQFFIDALEQYDFFKLEGIIYDLVDISTPDDFFSNLKGRVLNA